MNDFTVIIGVLGSIASIASLLIAAPNWKSRLTHIGYAFIITIITAYAIEYRNDRIITELEIDRYKNVEIQAKYLLESRDQSTAGSAKGFMLASLTFLEKNKIYFPDTYQLGKKLCENAGCTESGYTSSYSQSDHFNRMYEGATAMRYLIRGIIPAKME